MADIADATDYVVNSVVVAGREKIERDLVNHMLHPLIILLDDDSKCGICLWCESPITPGHLFCERDPHDDGRSCSESWDHDHKRRKDSGL